MPDSAPVTSLLAAGGGGVAGTGGISTEAELPAYATALQTLASSQMIRPREPA
jgi:hypothetical protein